MSEPVEKTETTEQQTGSDVAALQREIADLKTAREAAEKKASEHEQGLRYWYEKASGAKAEKPPAAKEEEQSATDLLDLITTKGEKGLRDWMKGQGYVAGDDVQKMVDTKAQQIARETRLLDEYPDLKDQASDFFKATATEYSRLKDAGVPEHVAMETAAGLAEAKALKSGKRKAAADKDEKESEKQARKAAQGGNSARGTKSAQQEEEDDDMSAEQLAICEKMGIDPEKYKARAKQGTQMWGKR